MGKWCIAASWFDQSVPGVPGVVGLNKITKFKITFRPHKYKEQVLLNNLEITFILIHFLNLHTCIDDRIRLLLRDARLVGLEVVDEWDNNRVRLGAGRKKRRNICPRKSNVGLI